MSVNSHVPSSASCIPSGDSLTFDPKPSSAQNLNLSNTPAKLMAFTAAFWVFSLHDNIENRVE